MAPRALTYGGDDGDGVKHGAGEGPLKVGGGDVVCAVPVLVVHRLVDLLLEFLEHLLRRLQPDLFVEDVQVPRLIEQVLREAK